MTRQTSLPVTLLSAALFASFALPFYGWIPDDAFISFQYAENLAAGQGLVFNPGERVEGISNLLWTLLLGLFARLGVMPDAAGPAFSFAFGVVALVLTVVLLTRTPVTNRFVVSALAVAACAFWPLAFYATSGMETTLYLVCLVAGATLHVVAERGRSARPYALSAVMFGLAALTRVEGIGFFLLSAWLAIRRSRSRSVATTFVAVLVLYTAIALLKRAYFGSFIPNTYFAKPSATWGYTDPLLKGAEYLIRFFGKSGLVTLAPFLFVVPRDRVARRTWVYLATLGLYQLCFVVLVGADVLRFDRFMVPFLPWFLALVTVGAGTLMERRREADHTFLKRFIVMAVCVIVVLNGIQAAAASRKSCVHDWMHTRAYKTIGTFLGNLLPADAEIVVNEIGALRYYSRRPVVDMLGLTDATVGAIRYHSFLTFHIGSSRWSAAATARYILEREPECIILPSYAPLDLDHANGNRGTLNRLWYTILMERGFGERFRPVIGIRIHNEKYLYVFVADRVALALPDALPGGRCLGMWWIQE